MTACTIQQHDDGRVTAAQLSTSEDEGDQNHTQAEWGLGFVRHTLVGQTNHSETDKQFFARHTDRFLLETFDNVISPFIRRRYKTSDGNEGFVYLIKQRDQDPRFLIESRGWTMQERLLSTRLLFFHPGRIDWVCRSGHLFAGCSSSYSVNLIAKSVAKNSTWDEYGVSYDTEHSSPK